MSVNSPPFDRSNSFTASICDSLNSFSLSFCCRFCFSRDATEDTEDKEENPDDVDVDVDVGDDEEGGDEEENVSRVFWMTGARGQTMVEIA